MSDIVKQMVSNALWGGGGSGGGTPDWNAAEGEPGHILNRTHWTEVATTPVVAETALTGVEGPYGVDAYLADPPLSFPANGAVAVVTWDGVAYQCTVGLSEYNGMLMAMIYSADATTPFNGIRLAGNEATAANWGGNYVWVSAPAGTASATIKIDVADITVHPIPEEYLKTCMVTVTYDEDMWPVCDKTYADVLAAYNEGKSIFCSWHYDTRTVVMPLVLFANETFTFATHSVDGTVRHTATLTVSGIDDGSAGIATGCGKAGTGQMAEVFNDTTNNKATDVCAHAEGYSTTASGMFSHAEGNGTTASGGQSHAEGNATVASGMMSHAEGYASVAGGTLTHAEGEGTKASSDYQHVQGRYNVEDTASKYAHIVGGGTADDARKNIHTIDWYGNAEFTGIVTTPQLILTDMANGSKYYVEVRNGEISLRQA